MGDIKNVEHNQAKETDTQLTPNGWSCERDMPGLCATPHILQLSWCFFYEVNRFNCTFFYNITVLVLSLVPDIFLACKCYHELLLVAMAVQKMDPLGRKQGS